MEGHAPTFGTIGGKGPIKCQNIGTFPKVLFCPPPLPPPTGGGHPLYTFFVKVKVKGVQICHFFTMFAGGREVLGDYRCTFLHQICNFRKNEFFLFITVKDARSECLTISKQTKPNLLRLLSNIGVSESINACETVFGASFVVQFGECSEFYLCLSDKAIRSPVREY